MNIKRFLSLLLALMLCLSSFAVFAEESSSNIEINLDEVFENEVSADESSKIADVVEDNSHIDYSDLSNWAFFNDGSENEADLFFVCPTVDMGRDGNLIADIENEKYRKSFIGATKMELGIYNESTSVYAPFYRQATFPVYNLPEDDRQEYLEFAYQDVKDAFIYYAEVTDPTRPLILAGFSQGADLIIRLMKDLFDEPKYQRRLVAAYAIGWKLTEEEVKEYPYLIPAQGETDTGVIVAFSSEAPEVASSIIVGENEKTYAINPLNWKTTSEAADKSLNKGACFTEYSGNINEEIPQFTGAYLDEYRGTLKVTDVDKEKYSSSLFDEGVYHLNDYQFFFRNLEENVKTRLAAYNEKYADRINVLYNNEIMSFDVEPVIENGRTLVPLRAIFEIMGCAVYYNELDGKQIVTAHRANDSLMLTIGENKMYFNGEEIALDVPAKIKNGRTLVPLRAISESFECEVNWIGETRSIYINSPAESYKVNWEKISQIITDEKGSTLIDAVAYYPVIKNYSKVPFVDEINEDYKLIAEKFIEEAKEWKENALLLKDQMGEEMFSPFVFEMTYEQNYNVFGNVSFTCYKHIYTGGVHPTNIMESRSFCLETEVEYSLTDVLDIDVLGESLTEYVTNLFVEKIKEISPETADVFTYDYVLDYIGYVQFYLTKDSVVLYINQGEVLPYALGAVSVEIPYDSQLFLV